MSSVLTAALKAIALERLGRQSKPFDEQLLSLFRNRAALKKSYNDLRTSNDGLKEKLRNSEAATRRAEERLEAIERLMAKPEAGYNGLVYFQLRTLWRADNEQLKGFADELRRQQEERERQRQIQRCQKDRDRRLEDLGDLIRRVKGEADRINEALDEARGNLAEATGLFAFLRRREYSREVEKLQTEHAVVRQRIEELFDRRIKFENEGWPAYEGLTIEGRRAINVAIIAFAHHLCAYFSENDVANRAREAVTLPIQDLKYGSEADCTNLIKRIQQLLGGLRDQRANARNVKEYAAEVRRQAKYRNELETVPLASSLANVVPAISNDGQPLPRADILRDEYWDVYDVFLR